VAGRRCDLRWRKRRWRSDQTDCSRRSFTESLPSIPARSRLTDRMRDSAGAVGDRGRTVVQSARDHGIAWPIVMAAVRVHAIRVIPETTLAVSVLSTDEIRRGKAKWRFEERTQSFVTMADHWRVGWWTSLAGQGCSARLGPQCRRGDQLAERARGSVEGWRRIRRDRYMHCVFNPRSAPHYHTRR
jgi:transposase